MTLAVLNTSLCASTPNLQRAWDSTSMGELKLCPRRYQYRILERWQPRGLNIHLIFGLAFHSALEHFDHSLSRGESRQQALRCAVRQALRMTWDYELKRPWMSQDSYKNRENLIRSVVWYLEEFKTDSIQTVQLANGKPAIELSFRFALDWQTPKDGPYLLCGHLDKIGLMSGFKYIVDRKSTGHQLNDQFFSQFSPDNQFSTYIAAGRIVFDQPVQGLICDAAQVLVNSTRFERRLISRTQEEIEEWLKDLQYWTRLAEFFAEQGHWPMNDKACHVYGGCPYRTICSKTPSVRETWLKAGFTQSTWDPLQVRGDI